MSKGRFGIHGGQYIPETLMNAVIELEEAYNHYKDDPEFNAGAYRASERICRKTIPSLLCSSHDRRSGWSKSILKERRFKPYRCSQNQQCTWSGTSCKKNGQDPCHCRNRRRSAWCGNSNSSSSYGYGM